MKLWIVPLELSEANAAITRWHRHHQPVVGHRFSIGVIDEEGTIHGAAVVGRPVARLAGDPRRVAEVTRLVTDGAPMACSMLYAAAARAAKSIGFVRIQTYILDTETGVSLRAAGWEYQGLTATRDRQWEHTDGKPRRTDQPTGPKGRWAKTLNPDRPDTAALDIEDSPPTLGLVG